MDHHPSVKPVTVDRSLHSHRGHIPLTCSDLCPVPRVVRLVVVSLSPSSLAQLEGVWPGFVARQP